MSNIFQIFPQLNYLKKIGLHKKTQMKIETLLQSITQINLLNIQQFDL